MFTHRAGVRSLVTALVVACGTAASVAALDVGVVARKGNSAITISGRTVHTTPGAVSNPRLISFPNSQTVVAMWNEAGASGAVTNHYGISLNGGRTLAITQETTHRVRMVYAQFDPLQGEPLVSPELTAAQTSNVYLVQFVVPPFEEMQRDIGALGGRIERFLTDHTHVVTMDAATAAKVRTLDHVRWVGRYHPAYRLSGDIRAWLAGGTESGAHRYSIECFQRGPEQQQAVAAQIQKLGGIVELTTPDQFRMEATLTRAQLLAIAAMDEVSYIDPWGGPGGTDMQIIRQLHGATDAGGVAIGGFSGQGVRGEVIDTEVRTGHNAFQSPPVLLHRNSAGDAGNPHGSSCYGINFADWAANASYNGMVTSAEQGIFLYYPIASQFGGSVSRLILNTEATNPAGPYWSSYQTSSVGSTQVTAYTTISAETDDYLFRMDYLSCQSQSNTGNQTSRPQAWAKNIVSVGGVEWHGTLTRNDDNWSTASYGPAADQRVKPDLTNCYADIPTTSNSSNSGTTSFGGTSGATPITAGCFGLLTQMWHEGTFVGFGGGSTVFSDRPRSMTAKAMMINTAFRYPLTQGQLNRARQGWGMPDIGNLYAKRSKMMIINETDRVTNAQTKTYQVCVGPGEPVMNVTLCYIDPMGSTTAGQARINDLSLKVTSPTGTVYRGNNGLVAANFSPAGGTADTRDTVENVFIQNPAAGNWTIEVTGTSIVADAYPATPGVNEVPIALVASGVLSEAPVIFAPNGVPDMLSPSVATTVAIRIVDGCQPVLQGSPTLNYRSRPSEQFVSIPLTHLQGDEYRATFPLGQCSDTPEFFFSAVGEQGAIVLLPSGAPNTLFSAAVGDLETRFADDFESEHGWLASDPLDTAVSGRWTKNLPEGTEAQPGADHTPSGGVCWVTDYRAGQQVSDYDVDGGRTTLISPLLDASNLTQATISYWRWYSNGIGPVNPNTNLFQVQITNNDGQNWLPVEQIGPSGPDTEPGWRFHSFLISSIVPPTSEVRVRFIAADLTDAIVEAAIDDFALTGVRCVQACYANCDESTVAPVLTANDFQCYLNKFSSGDPYANCDGSTVAPVLTANDFQCFINSFAGGCP